MTEKELKQLLEWLDKRENSNQRLYEKHKKNVYLAIVGEIRMVKSFIKGITNG